MLRLMLFPPNGPAREVSVRKERVTIGRKRMNDIAIDDGAVSSEHAVILCGGHEACVEDLDSTNGTRVNGQPVKKHYLRDDDVIEIGRHRLLYKADPA